MPRTDLDDSTAVRLLQLLRDYQDAVDLLTSQNQQLRLDNQRLAAVIVDELKLLGVTIREGQRPTPVITEVLVPVQVEVSQVPAANPAPVRFPARPCRHCGQPFDPMTKHNRTCPTCKSAVYRQRGFALQRKLHAEKAQKALDTAERQH